MTDLNSADNNVLLAFAGDFVPANISKQELSQAFILIDSKLSECYTNTLVYNLEAALTQKHCKHQETGSSVVQGDRDLFVNGVKDTQTDHICSLANNHIVDFSKFSLFDTIETLEDLGIRTYGAGDSPESAHKPLILEFGNIRIGLIAFCSTRKCVGDHLKTEQGSPISLLDGDTVQLVEELSQCVDHVVVTCHWGREFIHYPIPEDRGIAHSIIDSGASLIIGHHPHVLQGYEKYKNGLVFYSLGNFIFPDQDYPHRLRWNKDERTGVVACIKFRKDSISLESLMPVRFENKELHFLTGTELKKILSRIEKWSSAFYKKNYKVKYEYNVRMMVIKKIAHGIFRNVLRPRKRHLTIFWRLAKQAISGRKSFLK